MQVLPFRSGAEVAAAVPRVIAHLRRDRLIAYPTETVYGFGSAVAPQAVSRLTALKRREPAKPFLLLIETIDSIPGVHWTRAAHVLAERFWPGPLTVVLHAESAALPEGIAAANGTIAVRATSHPGVRALLHALHAPLTSTSANAPAHAAALDAAGVIDALHTLDDDDVLLLDGGPLPPSPPSTLVRIMDRTVHILREGAISLDALRTGLEGTGIDVA